MSQNFDFLGLPKELTTGSSIMPHKQNPDVFELMRGKCNEIQAIPVQLMMMTTNLTSGYHRDYQLLKESFMKAIELTKANISMAHLMIDQLIVKESKTDLPLYDSLFSVELLNKRVLDGASFRDAYKQVGQEIMADNFQPPRDLHHTHEGSIGNLCTEEIRAKWELAYQ